MEPLSNFTPKVSETVGLRLNDQLCWNVRTCSVSNYELEEFQNLIVGYFAPSQQH